MRQCSPVWANSRHLCWRIAPSEARPLAANCHPLPSRLLRREFQCCHHRRVPAPSRPPRTQHPHRRAHQRRPCTAALTTAAPAVPVLPTPLPAALLAPAPPSASIAARQRRHPPRRPIKPRIPSLHCGGPRAQLARIAPYASPFPPNARNKPPSWQHLRLMHAFRGKNGKILAPCIHFRVQSGGFGYMARESCRQGWLFASRGPRSCMAQRTCQRCSTSSWQRPAVWSNGLCALSPIPGLLDA